MKELKKYINTGLSIDKTKTGFRVFTIKTQHFNINSLDELTLETFEAAEKNHKESERYFNAIIKDGLA